MALQDPIAAAIAHSIEASRARAAVAGQADPEAGHWRAYANYHSRRSASILRWFVADPRAPSSRR